MLNLKTLYPYTNQSIEEVNEKLENSEFDGIVLPVGSSKNKQSEVVVFRQNNFLNGHHFDSKYQCVRLDDFMKEINLQDKQIFLSFIGLFDNFSGGNLAIERLNYEILRKTINEINKLTDNIVINNDLYHPTFSIEEHFIKLKKEFPNIDYVYTNYSQNDNISMIMDNIVARNMGYDEIIKYINLGKKIYFPEFESSCLYYNGSRITIYNLLQYYYSEGKYNCQYNLNFDNANLTVISTESKSKILERTLK